MKINIYANAYAYMHLKFKNQYLENRKYEEPDIFILSEIYQYISFIIHLESKTKTNYNCESS